MRVESGNLAPLSANVAARVGTTNIIINEPMPTKYNVSIVDDGPLVMDADVMDATEAPGKP